MSRNIGKRSNEELLTDSLNAGLVVGRNYRAACYIENSSLFEIGLGEVKLIGTMDYKEFVESYRNSISSYERKSDHQIYGIYDNKFVQIENVKPLPIRRAEESDQAQLRALIAEQFPSISGDVVIADLSSADLSGGFWGADRRNCL